MQRAAFFVPAAVQPVPWIVITVHVSLTTADWLEARDQEKVTRIKLASITTRFPTTTSIKKHFVNTHFF